MTGSISRGEQTPPLLTGTIGANLDATVGRHGERDALIDVQPGRRWSYAELGADVDRLATGLDAAGLRTGDRIGIWAPNCAEWTLTQFATAKLGAILVNINPAYRTHELEFVLRQSGCSTLVAARSFKTSDYAAMIDEVALGLDTLTSVVLIGSPEWEALTSTNVDPDRLSAIASDLDENDPINIQHTSGTTGFPKGATLTHRNILNNGYLVGEVCGYSEADRICIPVPFYHCFGMVMGNLAAITHGSAMVIPAPGFDPAATLTAVADERCTSLYGVPTMFIAELALPDFADYDLTSLRTGIMAGSPCPIEVMRRVVAEMHCPEVTICYGMTETSPVSTQTRTDDELELRVSTVGTVHPHVEVKVVAPGTEEPLPHNEPGELCTRGYSVMSGYWDEPELTAEVLDADGWMHTGDLATMDAAGYVKIVGRIKDMVIRGGENVYPREIEEFLYSHPAVVDVQVVGVPDERFGEQLCALIRLNEGIEIAAEEIRDYCRGRLAHYKVPQYVLFVDEFPMTVTGKVQKYLLRERATEELGLAAPGSGVVNRVPSG